DSIGAALLFVTEAEQEARLAIEALMEKEIPQLPLPEDLRISDQLTEEEKHPGPEKNYLTPPPVRTGAFHEKKEKNKKVNLGNKTKYLREKKYKKPIKKGSKRK
ncbi:MAG: ATP-dependent helicase, partial [Saprospiraceae bacterium]